MAALGWNNQVLRRFLAFYPGAAGRLAVGAQAAQRRDVAGVAVGRGGQHRVPRGNRTGPEASRREFPRPPATAAALAAIAAAAAFRSRLRLCGCFLTCRALPLPPGGLACPGFALRALPRRRSCSCAADKTSHPAATGATRTAGHRPGHGPTGPASRRMVFSDGATYTPAACAAGSPAPSAPAAGGRSPFPGRSERVAPGQPRRHRHRDHARQGEPHAPPVPRSGSCPATATASRPPGGQRISCEHLSSSDRLDGNGAPYGRRP